MSVIDAHTHVVPARLPPDPARDRRWPSVEIAGDNGVVMIAGKVFRKLDHRSWDVAKRLADMDRDDNAVQVLSPMPELLSHWLPPDDAEHLGDIINDHIADLIAQAPQRFAGIGMVCVQDMPRALRQLDRLKALGLNGIEIGTHIDGVALGADVLHPLYEAAEALDLAIMIHPLHPAGVERVAAGPEFAATTVFPLETALAAASLLAADVPGKYPKLRVMLSHGGGALPWILPRMDHGWSLGGDMRKRMPLRPSEAARRFYYDSVVYDPAALRFLEAAVGTDRIVVGSDYPFAIEQKQPGHFVREALPHNGDALCRNALALLGRSKDQDTPHESRRPAAVAVGEA